MDEENKRVNTVAVSSSDSGESLFTVQLTPEVASMNAIQSKIAAEIVATVKLIEATIMDKSS